MTGKPNFFHYMPSIGISCINGYVETDNNSTCNETFESKPVGLDVDQQMDMYINRKKVIGTKITLRYYERTVRNIPFHTNVII